MDITLFILILLLYWLEIRWGGYNFLHGTFLVL